MNNNTDHCSGEQNMIMLASSGNLNRTFFFNFPLLVPGIEETSDFTSAFSSTRTLLSKQKLSIALEDKAVRPLALGKDGCTLFEQGLNTYNSLSLQ